MDERPYTVNVNYYGETFLLPLVPKEYVWWLQDKSLPDRIVVELSVRVSIAALQREGYMLDLSDFEGESLELASGYVKTDEEGQIAQEEVDKLAFNLEIGLVNKKEALIDEIIRRDVLHDGTAVEVYKQPVQEKRPSILGKLRLKLQGSIRS